MKYFTKIYNLIKKFIFPIKYHITLDNGMFDISVKELFVAANEEVIVERTSKLPKNIMNVQIKVFGKNREPIVVGTIRKGLKWKFIMPKSDVIIIPIAKRKFRDF